MFYRIKLLLLLTTLLSRINTLRADQQVTQENSFQVRQMISQLLRSANTATDLLLVAGYLRLFAPSSFLVEIKKLIFDYADGVNYYPYIYVDLLECSKSVVIKNSKQEKPHSYIYLTPKMSAAIYQGEIHIINNNLKGKNSVSCPSDTFLKYHGDQLAFLFPLEDHDPHFSFLVLSRAGRVTYLSSTNGSIEANITEKLCDFSEFQANTGIEKVCLCRGIQPLTFFFLLNTSFPTLRFNRILEKKDKREVYFTHFDTSLWHRNCENSFHNFTFLGDQHFVILNQHPDIGSRLFLYHIDRPKPIGYISLDQKYSSLRKFLPNTLHISSEDESSSMIFNHATQNFFPVPGIKNLRSQMVLANTNQIIMSDVSSQEKKRIKESKIRKLFLCNLTRSELVIQNEFYLKEPEGTNQDSDIWCKELPNSLLKFCIDTNSPDLPSEDMHYVETIFSLVKAKSVAKHFKIK